MEEGEHINDFYLEPILFENENGPTIGVTTCGVIVQDGLYFKDMDNDGVLSPYEDWRNDDEIRAKDEEGNINPVKVFKLFDPSEKIPAAPFPGMTMKVDDTDIIERKLTAGVYRGDMRAEVGVAALYHNLGTQYIEYESCQGGVDTDPRWPRNSGTYGERPDITSGITKELVRGYQNGEDGLNEGAVVLTVNHFPGDGPAENGFEPHISIGQWRLHPTAGSMEKYHLPPFQAAFDMNASSIMPDYSRVGTDSRSVPQYYKGKLTSTEEVGSAYSKELITDLARDTMGFDGYVNSDFGITAVQIYGVEELSVPERYAKCISAGTDVVGGNSDTENIIAAVEQEYLPKKDLDRANYRRLLSLFKQKRVDNPYLDPNEADRVREENLEGAKQALFWRSLWAQVWQDAAIAMRFVNS